MLTVYRVGRSLFVIEVEPRPTECVASAWRLEADDRLARVEDPDGTPFQASAPSAWQAQLRASTRLESFLRDRAYEQRDVPLKAWKRDGTWRLPQ